MASELLELRSAVRPYLENLTAGDCALVAVSGGADSLALAYALLKEAPDLAINLIGVTIDHQLQSGSGKQAQRVLSELKLMGYQEVLIKKVVIEEKSGLEADARTARYAALDEIANTYGATQIFLGHTRDDQAETVLLGLSRGSGTRSLSGMAQVNGKYARPFLQKTRAQTQATCKEVNLNPWDDPHNENTKFSRVRVRSLVLPLMEKEIGPGIAAALARSAGILRDDADALDEMAQAVISRVDLGDLDCAALTELPRAIRSRVLRAAIYAAGAPSGSLSADHLASVEALVTSWHGQGEASLPGGVKVARISGRLSLLARP
ncbi:MAG: tRNA lysidine(34) synthetase TilS [Candidatus Planktophila sp.]|jgi:tRNA(Ile)-lysidine synthase|tara:strand:+ start:4911 stop:5873 length:963 start_codon:yes stop_codon:yes gene_type:complete